MTFASTQCKQQCVLLPAASCRPATGGRGLLHPHAAVGVRGAIRPPARSAAACCRAKLTSCSPPQRIVPLQSLRGGRRGRAHRLGGARGRRQNARRGAHVLRSVQHSVMWLCGAAPRCCGTCTPRRRASSCVHGARAQAALARSAQLCKCTCDEATTSCRRRTAVPVAKRVAVGGPTRYTYWMA